MNVTSTLEQLDIKPTDSVVRAIKRVSEVIEESGDKLVAANKIIASLGAPTVSKERTASVLAKGLIEQVLVQGEKYEPSTAMTVVAGKYMKLVDDLPGSFETKGDPWKQPKVKSESRTQSSADKKVRALEIFESNKSLGNSDIAKIIAKDLGITFANAYYYCSRVFVR